MVLKPCDARWGLPVRGEGALRTAMVEWEPLDDIEGGVPARVAEAAGDALVTLGRVAYLVDDDKRLPVDGPWTGGDDRPRRRVRPSGLLPRLRRPARTMEATDEAQTAAGLFYLGHWSLQFQLGIVCDRAKPLPLVSHGWIEHDVLGGRGRSLEQLPPDVLAVAVPGVDGDYIGLVCANQAVLDELTAAWSRAAAARGMGWEVVDEPAYLARISRARDGDKVSP
jgi:hypothetical protein